MASPVVPLTQCSQFEDFFSVSQVPEALPDVPLTESLSEAGQHLRAWRALRRWLQAERLLPEESDGAVRPRWLMSPLRSLPKAERRTMVESWLQRDGDMDPETRAYVETVWLKRYQSGPQAKHPCEGWFRGSELLLTYNGDWGLIPWAVGVSSLDDVCRSLRSSDRILHLKEALSTKMEVWMVELGFDALVWSIELSKSSYEEAQRSSSSSAEAGHPGHAVPGYRGVPAGATAGAVRPVAAHASEGTPLRVHVHIFMRFAASRRRVKRPDCLRFCGSLPRKSHLQFNSGTGRRRNPGNAGCYYLQCPKKGMVMWGGTMEPYAHYQVNGEWIMNLVQMQKMTYENAKAELLRVVKGLPRQLQTLDLWYKEMKMAELQEEQRKVEVLLRAQMRPFWTVPIVEDWKHSYTSLAMRYKFLVLDGPSRTGKSAFARSLASSPSACLELDCSGASEPDARGFQRGVHDAIIYDEASVDMILACKKLMQAGIGTVTMGGSRTNIYSYSIWVHAIKMIVCSNTWQAQLRKAEPEDAAWVEANSVYLSVTHPLYQDMEMAQESRTPPRPPEDGASQNGSRTPWCELLTPEPSRRLFLDTSSPQW